MLPPSAALFLLVVQAPDSLDLARSLARAREARAQVAAASAVVTRARGAAGLLSLIPNPSLQFEVDDLSPTRKLVASQPLTWLLRYGADRAAGQAGVRRAAADSTQMLADLGGEVRRAFYGGLAARDRARLADEQVVVADSALTLAQRRVDAGDISVLDRDQVAQEAARARLLASRAREGALAAQLAFGRSVAWDGPALPAPSGSLDEGLDAPSSPAESGDASALPAVRAAVADSAAAAARLSAARIAQLPMPSIVVGREWGAAPANNTILGLAISVPLWNHGGAAAREASGLAALNAAIAVETRRDLELRLANARLHVTETAVRARIARDSILPSARRIRVGALRLYEAQRTGILSVFEALRAERDAAQAAIDELLAFQEARADLAAMLGQWD